MNYYKFKLSDNTYKYYKSKKAIRNLKQASEIIQKPVIQIYFSGLIPYLFNKS